MLLRLLLLFVVLPLVELALLLWLADVTSWQLTFGLVICTGVLGGWLARHEGLRCWRAVQEQLARGELPADSLLDGLLILVAGAVLITPGVITDLAGFALLVPPIRGLVKRYLVARFQARMIVAPMSGFRDRPPEGDVIDVEHRPADDAKP